MTHSEKSTFKNKMYNYEHYYKPFISKWDGKESMELFRGFNTPSFAIFNKERTVKPETMLICNPVLQSVDWFKKFDTFTTYQEISMFLGGVLGNVEDNNIPMSDKDKVLSHGFDIKSSFRKEKQSK